MIEAGSLEYAFARMSARFGERPDEALWRRVEIIRDFETLVTAVRASSLSAWVVGVGPQAGVHAIEAAARRHWRQLTAELADWMPAAWRPAVLWCAVLLDLPALRSLAGSGPRPAWLREDPVYAGLSDRAFGAVDRERQALLTEGIGDAPRVLAAWRAEWERRLPQRLDRLPALAELERLLRAHAMQFAGAHPADGWPLRRALGARLKLMFRRAPLDPAMAFIYLALAALEFERIRAELLRRRAFPRRALAA